jgi:proliferating cell nuclear antigen PCNA
MFTTVRPVYLKRLAGMLKDVICEGTLRFESDGVYLQELDVSQEVFVQVHLQAREFEEYKPHSSKVRINLIQFHNNFGSISKQDVMNMTIEDDIVCQKLSTQVRSRSHLLQTIPIAQEVVFGTDTQWDVRFSMPCVTFHSIIKELSAESSVVNIELEQNKVTFSTQTTIITHAIEATSSNMASFVNPCMRKFLNIKEPLQNDKCVYRGSFSSTNLHKIHRAGHLGPNIDVQLCNDCPMILKYSIGSLGNLTIGIKSL